MSRLAERILASLVAQAGENSPNTIAARFYIDIAKKDFSQARAIANAVAASFPASGFTATDLGTAYAMTGDLDSAIRWYRRALELREPQFPRVPYANPELTRLYADPRWKALRAAPEIRDWEEARAEIRSESCLIRLHALAPRQRPPKSYSLRSNFARTLHVRPLQQASQL